MNTIILGDRYDILSGPPKDTLFDACKYACSHNGSRIKIEFCVPNESITINAPNAKFDQMSIKDIRVMGIEHEDGSGMRFNLTGNCKASPNPNEEDEDNYESLNFKAYYDSNRRHGHIQFY